MDNIDEMFAAVKDQILTVHQMHMDNERGGPIRPMCSTCGVDYPCPTVEILNQSHTSRRTLVDIGQWCIVHKGVSSWCDLSANFAPCDLRELVYIEE